MMKRLHRFGSTLLLPLLLFLFAEGCVAKSRYLALEAEGKTLAERLRQEELKSAALEKEVEGLKERLEEAHRRAARMEEMEGTLRQTVSEMEEAKRAASQKEEEMTARLGEAEEKLAAARKSEGRMEEALKEETARLETLLEEAQREVSRLEEENAAKMRESEEQLAAARGSLEEARQEVSRLEEERTAIANALEEERGHLLAEAEERGREWTRLKEEFQEAIASHQALIESLNGKLGALEAERSGLQEQLAAQADEIAQLEKGMRMAEGEAARRKRELQEAASAHEALIGKLEKEIDEGNIKISRLKGRLSVEIVDKILFASGSDRITKEGKEVLRKVSEILRGVQENLIRVEGHTDNVPIGPKIIDRFPTNWELSTSRATQVVRYLAEMGVGPEKMVAIGLAEYRPVVSNETPEGRQRNRRIKIVLFPEDIQEIVAAVE